MEAALVADSPGLVHLEPAGVPVTSLLLSLDSSPSQLNQIVRSLHVSHHGDSRNPDKILVRPIYSLTVSALFLAGFYTVTGSFFASSALLTGLWLGFLYYELVHYRLHLSKADSGLLGYQRQGHFYHHFVDPNHCFGVTSPLWDLVFGTYRRVSARKP